MNFIPENFIVPEQLKTADFVIRKFAYADAELDYKAVMSSIDIIRATRGGGLWPTPNLTFLDNQIDLAWHLREFEYRSTFAYTIRSNDENECLGCIYIYPPGFRDKKSLEGDADISFWVSQKAHDQGLYKIVYDTLNDWLQKEWPFKNVIYTNILLP